MGNVTPCQSYKGSLAIEHAFQVRPGDLFGCGAGACCATTGSNFRSRKPGDLVFAHRQLLFPHHVYKFNDYYQFERKIGDGFYGNVYEATARPVDPGSGMLITDADQPDLKASPQLQASRHVAVKSFVLKKAIRGKDGDDFHRTARWMEDRQASFEAERQILAQLDHPHIVKMYECFEEKNTLYLVLELCRGGELFEQVVLRSRQEGGGGLDESLARKLFRQMLYAVSYLHCMRIVHHDIKTENFLILGEPGSPEEDMIKLCDFGTAVRLSDQMPRSMEKSGTLSYAAPEIYADIGADTCADVWSLGVVLYVILVGASPFRTSADEVREDIVRRIQGGYFEQRRVAWQNLSESAQDITHKFLIVDETKRLTCREALRHPWVDQVSHLSPRCTSLDGSPVTVALQALAALTHFLHFGQMQQIILVACAQVVSEAEVLNSESLVPWYELFFTLDRNQDGRLDHQEFVQGLASLLGGFNDVHDGQLEALARALDLDCNGTIEWTEWIAAAVLAVRGLTEDQEPLSTAFRLLDRPSGEGTIGAADLLAVVSCDNNIDVLSSIKREKVIEVLNQCISGNEYMGHHPTNAMLPPSLILADLRRVLEATVSGYEEAMALSTPQLPPHSSPAQWLRLVCACP